MMVRPPSFSRCKYTFSFGEKILIECIVNVLENNTSSFQNISLGWSIRLYFSRLSQCSVRTEAPNRVQYDMTSRSSSHKPTTTPSLPELSLRVSYDVMWDPIPVYWILSKPSESGGG